MKYYFLNYILILLSFILLSCAASEVVTGNPIDESYVAKIVDGKTTETQIISWFGPPTTTSSIGDNVLYVYKHCKTSGTGFYTGYFGQTKSVEKCNQLTITFDKNTGTVKAHNYQKTFWLG